MIRQPPAGADVADVMILMHGTIASHSMMAAGDAVQCVEKIINFKAAVLRVLTQNIFFKRKVARKAACF
jgi:hypothetical protein